MITKVELFNFQIDAVICRANAMRNNGKLGDYVIKERTKVNLVYV